MGARRSLALHAGNLAGPVVRLAVVASHHGNEERNVREEERQARLPQQRKGVVPKELELVGQVQPQRLLEVVRVTRANGRPTPGLAQPKKKCRSAPRRRGTRAYLSTDPDSEDDA